MRLSPTEREIIRQKAFDIFGRDSRVILFGSRVDDAKKGGDIDLLIEADGSSAELFSKKIRFITSLHLTLGEQKIDVVTAGSFKENIPLIVSVARETGVQL